MTTIAQKSFFGRTPHSLEQRVKDLARDYDMDAEDIAAKLDIDVRVIKPLMPRRAKGWILRDLRTGEETVHHSERRAYTAAQIMGLTDYTWGRVAR